VNARTKARYQSAAFRALRTFTQAFIASLTLAGIGLYSLAAYKSAALAGLAAVFALVQRWLDATDVPTIPPG
jgi:hypothetical protein